MDPQAFQSLIHYIELNRDGWWAAGLQRVVLGVIWQVSYPVPRQAVPELVEATLGLDLGLEVMRELDQLIRDEVLLEGASGLELSAEEAERLEQELVDATAIEQSARDRFLELAHEIGTTGDGAELWEAFCADVLGPLIADHGARLVQMLDPAADIALPDTSHVARFLEAQPSPDEAAQVRNLMQAFLEPEDATVRSFILRRLNAQLFVEAFRLPAATLEVVSEATSRPHRIRVFLDTNFLLAFLNLHDDVAIDAAERLIDLRDTISAQVNLQLYVLEETLNETRELLESVIHGLSDLRASGRLAAAASQFPHSNLTRKFLEAASQSNVHLSSEDFFGPIQRNLLALCRDVGVELFNEPHEHLSLDQEVIDDLHDLEDYQTRVRDTGAKAYEQNIHDLVLWHFVSRKQRSGAESPLECEYLVLTLDHGLIRFDNFKRRRLRTSFPVMYFPSNLVQLLQFWVPRDEAFERAIVSSFRVPFLLIEFDPRSEAITARILRTMARFEGIQNLRTETLVRILTNEALRSRLSTDERSEESDLQVVELAVVEEAQHMEAAAQSAAEKAAAEEESRHRAEVERERAKKAADRARDEADAASDDLAISRDTIDELTASLQQAETTASQMAQRVTQLEDESRERDRQVSVRRAWVTTASQSLLIAPVVAAATFGLFVLAERGVPAWIALAGSVAAGTALWLAAVGWLIGRRPELEKAAQKIRWVRTLLPSAAGAVVLGIVGSAIWDAVKSIFRA